MLQTVIHDRVAYTETITEGIGVLEYKDKKAKDEIKRLYEEVSALIMEPSYS